MYEPWRDPIQGDQMSLLKNRPKCSPTNFLTKLMHYLYHGKSSPKLWATFVIFKKTEQSKPSPMDKFSPNLVTLTRSSIPSD
jgi:hypothetical protein